METAVDERLEEIDSAIGIEKISDDTSIQVIIELEMEFSELAQILDYYISYGNADKSMKKYFRLDLN